MTEKLTKHTIRKWLEGVETGKEFHINDIRRELNIDPENSTLRSILSRDLVNEGFIKPSGRRDGWYRKIRKIEPINWWDIGEAQRLPLVFPYGVEDGSTFGFDDNIEIFYGDSIVVAGVSNWGKTTFVNNILVNNIDLFEQNVLMVNEYRPQRFKNRMGKMTWNNIWNGDGTPKFDLIPTVEDHIDFIKPNALNIIDWVNLPSDVWRIGKYIEEMQMLLRNGILIVVLQKSRAKDYGWGGESSEFIPAAYFAIDPPGKLTVRKIKSAPKGGMKPEGKMYGFEIIDGGTKFHNIREVSKCPKCKGWRVYQGANCDRCDGKGYIDKED